MKIITIYKALCHGWSHYKLLDNVDDTIVKFHDYSIAHLMGIEALAFVLFTRFAVLCFMYIFCVVAKLPKLNI